MIADYEDDAHFCLKCHMTVIGLENYVNHRKTGCSKSLNVVEIPKSPLPSQLLPPDESFALKADDFFSSLELQSSSKKAPVPSTSGKAFSGILTRSKTSAVIQANKEGVVAGELQPSKSGKNAWIGGHQLKELGSGDNQTKLIKAVDNLSRNACLKKEDPPDIRVYDSDDDSDESDYEDDEFEDDDDVPPRSYTGGKWKPSSPISEWSEPPPSFTGGKWKPNSAKQQPRIFLSPPQNHTKGKWKPASPIHHSNDLPSPSFTGSKWTPAKARNEYGDIPPPNHTKGKWKPTNLKDKLGQHSRWDDDSNEAFPPPAHTKGKWKPVSDKKPCDEKVMVKRKITEESPPFRKSNGSVQYWCGPCNRRLASKIVYDRHLKSELHYKRTLHDAEFDDSSHLNTNRDKEAERKTAEYWPHTAAAPDNEDTMKNTRVRRRIYVKCLVCRSRVTSQMMGKHLISHYHCRKGDITLPEARRMVLDNIYNIVLQSPYQCGACKFYCNTQEYFLQHWNSEQHKTTIHDTTGYLWCAFCKFSCSENQTMLNHLISNEHTEVISVINRSVPIIIKQITPITCETCTKQFLLNIQLRKHCEKENHQYSGTSSDEYQKKHYCQTCKGVFKSIVALQRHITNAHNEKVYFCSTCTIQFDNSEDISKHRKSAEHRYAVIHKSKLDTPRQCEYCNETFKNFLLLKHHLKESHPERSHGCPHCGKKFTIPQELTVHIRSKSCSFLQEQKPNACDHCPYSSDSLADLLFHKALHGEPIPVTPTKATARLQVMFKCPLCDKSYPKASLRCHIQKHTNEKNYVCSVCGARFARKNNWKYHLKSHEDGERPRREPKQQEKADKVFLCAVCGANFNKNSVLQKHMMIHNGKKFRCSQPDCFHSARSAAELKRHEVTHSDEKSFQCENCDYRGKTKQQLKRHSTSHEDLKKFKCSKCDFTTRLSFHLRRHERIHTGSKPYACPHCEYRCNNLENLRKHVLSTNKHPGKCIYECKFCEDDQFQTNFARDFRVHLIAEHGDVFQTGTEVASYIAGIYHGMAEEDGDDDDDNMGGGQKEDGHVDAEVGVKIGEEGELRLGLDDGANVSGMDIAQQEAPYGNKEQEDLFPMYIIAKDEVVCVDKDTWSMVASFDVEESGALVSFNEEGETFFQERFE